MNLIYETAKDVVTFGFLHIGYDSAANAALNLGMPPAELLTFALAAYTASSTLENLPPYMEKQFPLAAKALEHSLPFWALSISVGAVFGKYITEAITNASISWAQTAKLAGSKIVVMTTHLLLLSCFEEGKKANPVPP